MATEKKIPGKKIPRSEVEEALIVNKKHDAKVKSNRQ